MQKLLARLDVGCTGLLLVLAMNFATVWTAAAGDQVLIGPRPSWVAPATDAPDQAVASGDEGLRILLLDSQFRAEEGGQSGYMHMRSAAFSPQGLALLGNVALMWSPATQDVTVHHVDILRDGQRIDVLAGQAFETLRREQNLEQAMLDGQLTAVLQPSGLRVGDVLDVAYTLTSRDPVIGNHAQHAADLNLPVMADQIRYRASWPSDRPVRLRAANDWTPLRPRRQGDHTVVELRLDAIEPVFVPEDVPLRMRAVRRIELSDYSDWSDVAATLKPLYDRARALDPGSPLLAEIERIRALSDDPTVRAAAALRLVQDQIRYVALIMGEGALTPATADETWARRFGDCKAKTALLLALLDGLGVEAQPVVVSIADGDGMAERLPTMAAFDHVLVKVVIEGRVHWLDGTRTGDRGLETLPVPAYHWALPLTGSEARLEPLTAPPLDDPLAESRLDFDASEGLYAPASVTGTMVMRGVGAAALGAQIGLLSAAQKDQALRSLWSTQMVDPVITEVQSTYDVTANVLTLGMKGTKTLDWKPEGLILPGSTYATLSTEERPEGPFRHAPYVVNHPTYARQVATLKLPDGGAGFRVSGGRFDRTELGHHVRRDVELREGVVTIEIIMRSLVDEISAAEADAVRTAARDRPYDPPRVFAASGYSPTEADRSAWEAATPTTANGWLDRALALSRARDWSGAVEAAGRAVELDPGNSAAWANRGVYRYWAGDLKGAEADLEKAVDLDPSERIAMNGHALLAIADRRYDDAVIELSRALRQAPGDDFALNLRATAYIALKQYDRGLRDIDALIAARPTDMGLRMRRIWTLQAADRADQASAELDELARSHPADRLVRLNQAQMKLGRDEPQAALDIIDDLHGPAPSGADAGPGEDATLLAVLDPQALLISSEAAMALGRLDRAAADMARLRASGGSNADRLNSLCWTAALRGVLLDQALKDCDAALALEPGSPAILDSRGRVLLQRGDPAGALAAYEAALKTSPDLPASLYGRGLARIALGQVEAGEADKARALEIDPDAAENFKAYNPGGDARPDAPAFAA